MKKGLALTALLLLIMITGCGKQQRNVKYAVEAWGTNASQLTSVRIRFIDAEGKEDEVYADLSSGNYTRELNFFDGERAWVEAYYNLGTMDDGTTLYSGIFVDDTLADGGQYTDTADDGVLETRVQVIVKEPEPFLGGL